MILISNSIILLHTSKLKTLKLTLTHLTAFITFLLSRFFNTLVNCVLAMLDRNLMSRIHIPLLPASSIKL